MVWEKVITALFLVQAIVITFLIALRWWIGGKVQSLEQFSLKYLSIEDDSSYDVCMVLVFMLLSDESEIFVSLSVITSS